MPTRRVGFLVAVLLLVVGVPLAFYAATPAPRYSEWGWSLPVVVLAGLRLAWLISDGERRLYDLTVVIFFYFFLGLAPFVQVRTGIFPGTTPDIDPSQVEPALWVILLSFLFYMSGYFAPRGRHVHGRAGGSVHPRRAQVLAVAALLIALYYAATAGVGPQSPEVTQLSAGSEAIGRQILTASTYMTLLVAFVALAQLARSRHERFGSVLYLAVTVVLILLVNPVTTSRYIFGTVALSMAAVLGAYATPRRYRVAAAVYTVSILAVFPSADAFRYGLTPVFKASGPLDAMFTADFDAFGQITNALVYLERHGLTGGLQALGVPLFWVPRVVWPGKPLDTGVLLAEDRGYDHTNLSAPLPAELLINWGWIAVVAGMFLFGLVCRRADERVLAGIRLHGVPSVLGCIMPAYLFIILRGSLLQAMAYLLVILLCSSWVAEWRIERRAPG